LQNTKNYVKTKSAIKQGVSEVREAKKEQFTTSPPPSRKNKYTNTRTVNPPGLIKINVFEASYSVIL